MEKVGAKDAKDEMGEIRLSQSLWQTKGEKLQVRNEVKK